MLLRRPCLTALHMLPARSAGAGDVRRVKGAPRTHGAASRVFRVQPGKRAARSAAEVQPAAALPCAVRPWLDTAVVALHRPACPSARCRARQSITWRSCITRWRRTCRASSRQSRSPAGRATAWAAVTARVAALTSRPAAAAARRGPARAETSRPCGTPSGGCKGWLVPRLFPLSPNQKGYACSSTHLRV